MLPLDGPRLKVRRAKSEIERLGDLQIAFIEGSQYHVIQGEFNPKTGECVYRVSTHSPPPDPGWGVSIGEISHNLRSALDGLVYQLALLKTKTPTGDTQQQFPIFLHGRTNRRDRKGNPIRQFEFRRGRNGKLVTNQPGIGRRMIRDLCPPHQAIIERLQPYKRGRKGRQCPLYWLQEINNADKHRLIQVVAAKWGAGPFLGFWPESADRPPSISIRRNVVLKDGAIFGEGPCNMHMHPKVIPLVAFSEGCEAVRLKSVTFTLGIIAEHVSEIVESFAPEFSVIS